MSRRYIVGDIHGSYEQLLKLMDQIALDIHPKQDKIIFLGDYVNYGSNSYQVVDFLIQLSQQMSIVTLLGDHDYFFQEFINNPHEKLESFCDMGGKATLRSYDRQLGNLNIPDEHIQFIQKLKLTYEENDFFCVHAGLNPDKSNIREQKVEDLISITNRFYESKRVWKKLIVFGHTHVENIHDKKNIPYYDKKKNLLGLDTGAGQGGRLSCFEVYSQRFYQA